jgi:hypothetical protein
MDLWIVNYLNVNHLFLIAQQKKQQKFFSPILAAALTSLARNECVYEAIT